MRSRTPDRLCVEAVGLARAAAEELAGAGAVGEHADARAEGDRVVTHYFVCKEPAYRGWQWAVTVTRASRGREVTVDEAVLLPGAEALLAPAWVPWSERLRPGDMGPGDLLPTEADDPRLEPGWTGADQPVERPAREAEAAAAERARVDELAALSGESASGPASPLTPTAEAEDDADAGAEPGPAAAATDRGAIASLALELGFGRPRVLSRLGEDEAADRWEESFGAATAMAQQAPAQCVSCGFLVRIGGRLGREFGVCSNEISPADGRMVSLAFGCGGHSEAAVMPAPPRPSAPVLDELSVDEVTG